VNRAQLEHIIRAAAAITEDEELIVIGSQSILGQFPTAPDTLLRSMEADLYPRHHPERTDLIIGSLGEESMFHRTFGYYGDGVSPQTAKLPSGWEERLVPIRNPNTNGATGWALEVHDLLIAKYFAAREKDRYFTAEAVKHGLADERTLLDRLAATDVELAVRERISAAIRADAAAARRG
jgi:hypothetical protein